MFSLSANSHNIAGLTTECRHSCIQLKVNFILSHVCTTNNNRKVFYFQYANEMRGAETAGQQAAKQLGLVKDSSRGVATDWFVGSSTKREVFVAVQQAVYKHNAKNK